LGGFESPFDVSPKRKAAENQARQKQQPVQVSLERLPEAISLLLAWFPWLALPVSALISFFAALDVRLLWTTTGAFPVRVILY
jgi:hypothetical protein